MANSQFHNPYVGPRPFKREEQSLFFGREREISELQSLVTAHRTLLIYAASGAGKTSLLNAGLLPLMEREGFEVLPVARVKGLIPGGVRPEDISNLYGISRRSKMRACLMNRVLGLHSRGHHHSGRKGYSSHLASGLCLG